MAKWTISDVLDDAKIETIVQAARDSKMSRTPYGAQQNAGAVTTYSTIFSGQDIGELREFLLARKGKTVNEAIADATSGKIGADVDWDGSDNVKDNALKEIAAAGDAVTVNDFGHISATVPTQEGTVGADTVTSVTLPPDEARKTAPIEQRGIVNPVGPQPATQTAAADSGGADEATIKKAAEEMVAAGKNGSGPRTEWLATHYPNLTYQQVQDYINAHAADFGGSGSAGTNPKPAVDPQNPTGDPAQANANIGEPPVGNNKNYEYLAKQVFNNSYLASNASWKAWLDRNLKINAKATFEVLVKHTGIDKDSSWAPWLAWARGTGNAAQETGTTQQPAQNAFGSGNVGFVDVNSPILRQKIQDLVKSSASTGKAFTEKDVNNIWAAIGKHPDGNIEAILKDINFEGIGGNEQSKEYAVRQVLMGTAKNSDGTAIEGADEAAPLNARQQQTQDAQTALDEATQQFSAQFGRKDKITGFKEHIGTKQYTYDPQYKIWYAPGETPEAAAEAWRAKQSGAASSANEDAASRQKTEHDNTVAQQALAHAAQINEAELARLTAGQKQEFDAKKHAVEQAQADLEHATAQNEAEAQANAERRSADLEQFIRTLKQGADTQQKVRELNYQSAQNKAANDIKKAEDSVVPLDTGATSGGISVAEGGYIGLAKGGYVGFNPKKNTRSKITEGLSLAGKYS
jgi:hypothetical protein